MGDVFIIKKDKTYTSLKINKTTAKEITYILNDYEVSEKEMIYSINLQKNYTDYPITKTKKDFENMKKQQL